MPLEQFCDSLGTIMQWPTFVYDSENKYQWGFVQFEQGCVEINISRLHEPGQSGLVSYTIGLIVSEAASPEFDETWLNQNLMPKVASGLKSLREMSHANG